MKTKLLLLLLGISISLNCIANDHFKYAVFNIGINGLIGSLGSGIHKKPNETFLHAFGQGLWKGSISGSLNTVSKELLFIQSNKGNLDWKLCWSSKIVNSFSNTMLYNATINESNLFNHYAIDIGFLRFSTDYKIQIEPISLGCFVGIFIAGGSFDSKKSLTIGTPIFNFNFKRNDNPLFSNNFSLGQTFANNILIEKRKIITQIQGSTILSKVLSNTAINQTLSHESIHTFQRLQYSSINNFFKIYNKYENFKYFHNDLSSFDLLYYVQTLLVKYNNNIFEKESNFYGSTNY
jgi:hypothetical protein